MPISAWSGPWGYSESSTDGAAMAAYAAAFFNVAQISDRTPDHAHLSVNASFEFLSQGIALAAAHGMGAFIDTYGPISRPFGGLFGGQFAGAPPSRFLNNISSIGAQKRLTMPELQWLGPTLRDGFPNVVGLLITDDGVDLTSEQLSMAAWLNASVPEILPVVNECQDGAVWVARSGASHYQPELYAMMDPSVPPSIAAAAQAAAYDVSKASAARWGLLFWPLIGVQGASSHSATAFQVHAALAYGASGVGYFCWSWMGSGLWNGSAPIRGNYDGAVEANANMAAWGGELQAYPDLAGVYHTGNWSVDGGASGSYTRSLQDGVLEAMSEELMVGLLLPAGAGAVGGGVCADGSGQRIDGGTQFSNAGWQAAAVHPCIPPGSPPPTALALVVDKRVSWDETPASARFVSLTFGAAVSAVEIVRVSASALAEALRDTDRWDFARSAACAALEVERLEAPPRDGAASFSVNVSLTGGGGALLRLWGAGTGGCSLVTAAAAHTSWRFPPSAPAFAELKTCQWSFYGNDFSALPTVHASLPIGVRGIDELVVAQESAGGGCALSRCAGDESAPLEVFGGSMEAPTGGSQGALCRSAELAAAAGEASARARRRCSAASRSAPSSLSTRLRGSPSGDLLRALAASGFNLFSAGGGPSGNSTALRALLDSAMNAGGWLLLEPPGGADAWAASALDAALAQFGCHPAFAGVLLLGEAAAPASPADAAQLCADASAVRWRTPTAYTPAAAAGAEAACSLARCGLPIAPLAVPAEAGLVVYLAALAQLAGAAGSAPCASGTAGAPPAATAAWVGVDVCGAPSSAPAEAAFRMWAALAFGARGLLLSGLQRCDALGLDAVAAAAGAIAGASDAASIGAALLRAGQLGELWAAEPEMLPGALLPGAGSALVLQLPPAVAARAVYLDGGNASSGAPPALLIWDVSCLQQSGCASGPPRQLQVVLAPSVLGWGFAWDADDAKGFPTCDKTFVGAVVNLLVQPGGAELIKLAVLDEAGGG